MSRDAVIDRFVEDLLTFKAPGCFNPWAEAAEDDAPGNGAAARLARLRAHLSVEPRLILCGEAVGYQGGRCSGMPFTSERLMVEGAIPRITVTNRLSTRALPWSEPSATIVWKNLERLKLAHHTLLWNAFAIHPHRAGEPHTNRAPSSIEMKSGLPILEALLRCAPGARIVAVGERAQRALAALGSSAPKIRHPAFGGTAQFGQGLAEATVGLA